MLTLLFLISTLEKDKDLTKKATHVSEENDRRSVCVCMFLTQLHVLVVTVHTDKNSKVKALILWEDIDSSNKDNRER